MKFRHEWKHEINTMDKMILHQRLSAIMKHDSHSVDGIYHSRTLYFDDVYDTVLMEKINGVNCREKFRIRFYNGDFSYFTLEKKSKINGLCNKVSCGVTYEEVKKIICGDIEWMKGSKRPLLYELYSCMKSGLKPKTIVEYTREAFVFKPGNVRVTIDYDIKTGLNATDFTDPKTVMMPAGNPPIILEVKWDEFLPEIIQDAVMLPGRHSSAFSKYAQCRIYG